MDFKELNKTLKEAMGIKEDINNPYTVQDLNHDAKYIIGVLNKNLELLSKEDEDFDHITHNMLGAAEDLVAFLQDFRRDMEELKNAKFESVDEAIGDTLRQHHSLNGNPWVEEDAGKITFELLGLPIEYQLSRFVETDKETGEIVKERFQIEPTEAGRDVLEKQLEAKIADEFKKQVKDNYNIEVERIGGNTMVGVPNYANYKG